MAAYSFFATKLTRSRTRQEYPHSLSYQAVTFARSPSITLQNGASMMDEYGFPRKSTETSGSSEYWRIPFNGPSAAFLNAALSSSVVVDFSSTATRSTSETLGVGTRIA